MKTFKLKLKAIRSDFSAEYTLLAKHGDKGYIGKEWIEIVNN